MDTQTHLQRFLENASPITGDTVEIIDQRHFMYGSLGTVVSTTATGAILKLEAFSEAIDVSHEQIVCSISLQQLSAP